MSKASRTSDELDLSEAATKKRVETAEEAAADQKRLDIEYDRGFVDGLTAYAHWKDGVQYVGTCGTTLSEAIETRKSYETGYNRANW